jgi:hypothetical protein
MCWIELLGAIAIAVVATSDAAWRIGSDISRRYVPGMSIPSPSRDRARLPALGCSVPAVPNLIASKSIMRRPRLPG